MKRTVRTIKTHSDAYATHARFDQACGDHQIARDEITIVTDNGVLTINIANDPSRAHTWASVFIRNNNNESILVYDWVKEA